MTLQEVTAELPSTINIKSFTGTVTIFSLVANSKALYYRDLSCSAMVTILYTTINNNNYLEARLQMLDSLNSAGHL